MNLFEDLGNLSQLNVGYMINILKQTEYGNNKYSSISPIRNKFYDSTIGSTSKIVDVGVLKNGLTDLKKAYKKYDTENASVVQAFALYINGIAVAFGRYTEYELAGGTRSGILAYDFNAFRDEVKSTNDRVPNPNRYSGEDNDFDVQSKYEKKERSWSYQGQDNIIQIKKYAGTVATTRDLGTVFNIINKIAKLVNSNVTAKLVLLDTERQKKHSSRISQREIKQGVDELNVRLKKYKLSKKPTVDTIEKFIDYALNNPGKVVTFAGVSYKLVKQHYGDVNPAVLLGGGKFDIHYSAETPGIYSSLYITYMYDPIEMTLKPIKAIWTDKNNDTSQEAVLDPLGYAKSELAVKKIDKMTVMPRLLAMIKEYNFKKAAQIIYSLEKLGVDWPELEILKNSVEHDLAAKGKKK